ncbi:MAG: ABC transporter permease [Chloroflexi bacterium]|nr:ABC transporter permease [Chloroflexota bacterium]
MHGNFWIFCVRRLAFAVPLLFTIVVITFVLIRMAPGDPAVMLAGDAPTPEFLRQVREEYSLDKSWPEQLAIYLSRAARGDFGRSIYFRQPVFSVIAERIPATMMLTMTALALASVLGTALGIVAARHRNSAIDSWASAVSLFGYSIPTFWLGQLLVLLFAIVLNWLPADGMTTSRADYVGLDRVLDVLKHLILPVLTLTLFELALITRFTRTAMIEVLSREYVTVGYAKGLSDRQVLLRHALPNALLTTVTIIGLEFGVLVAGAVVTETIYSWPGMGRLFYDSIFRRDFPLLTGLFIVASSGVILANFIADVVYAVIDPRVYGK